MIFKRQRQVFSTAGSGSVPVVTQDLHCNVHVLTVNRKRHNSIKD